MKNEERQYFFDLLKEVRDGENSRLLSTKQFIQHGKTSVYRHCVSVAYASYQFAKKMKIDVDERSLIRGALLHDYFLYDWHIKSKNRPLHGFFHPKRALCNAENDFQLNAVEQDIIKNHMFPLTLYIPKYKETYLVCLADKYVSTKETLLRKSKKREVKSKK